MTKMTRSDELMFEFVDAGCSRSSRCSLLMQWPCNIIWPISCLSGSSWQLHSILGTLCIFTWQCLLSRCSSLWHRFWQWSSCLQRDWRPPLAGWFIQSSSWRSAQVSPFVVPQRLFDPLVIMWVVAAASSLSMWEWSIMSHFCWKNLEPFFSEDEYHKEHSSKK